MLVCKYPCCVPPYRLLEEEAAKRAELEQMHLQQQRTLSQTEAEKMEMVAEQLAKDRELQAAQLQLERLERERQGALEQYKVGSHVWMFAGIGRKNVILESTHISSHFSECLCITADDGEKMKIPVMHIHIPAGAIFSYTGGVDEAWTSNEKDKDLERQSGQTWGAGASYPARYGGRWFINSSNTMWLS